MVQSNGLMPLLGEVGCCVISGWGRGFERMGHDAVAAAWLGKLVPWRSHAGCLHGSPGRYTSLCTLWALAACLHSEECIFVIAAVVLGTISSTELG